jgi:hypothetical protein
VGKTPKKREGRPGAFSGNKFRLPPKMARQKNVQKVPCPARGSHGKDCICGGTGKVEGIK